MLRTDVRTNGRMDGWIERNVSWNIILDLVTYLEHNNWHHSWSQLGTQTPSRDNWRVQSHPPWRKNTEFFVTIWKIVTRADINLMKQMLDTHFHRIFFFVKQPYVSISIIQMRQATLNFTLHSAHLSSFEVWMQNSSQGCVAQLPFLGDQRKRESRE